MLAQYGRRGDGASGIVTSVETAIREGRLVAGGALPTVRDLARQLRVSPTTVAAAYRTLRARGLVHAQGRRGTRVSPRPPLPIRPVAPAPSHLRDVSLGNPDPALLPSLQRALARLPRRPGLYGEPANRPDLLALAERQLRDDGLPTDAVAVVGGALDGIERVLQAHLRPGDRIAVEDPGYVAVFDLVAALGLVAEPVAIDDAGPLPDDLARRSARESAPSFSRRARRTRPVAALARRARASDGPRPASGRAGRRGRPCGPVAGVPAVSPATAGSAGRSCAPSRSRSVRPPPRAPGG
jgi:DNA-binding transcriptional MocR family regulator